MTRYIAVLLVTAIMSSPQKAVFEVASVKLNVSGSAGGSAGPRGDRFVATNVPLRGLINFAFAPPPGVLLNAQIIGAPEWTNTDRFDVQAKMGGDVASIPRERLQEMVQSLLEDRFQMKAHRETRELPVYDLVIAKGGLKMKQSEDQTPPAGGSIHFDTSGQRTDALSRGSMRIAGSPADTTLIAVAVPVSKLLTLLQGQADRMIFDKTDLTALFDIQLRYSRDMSASIEDTPGPGTSAIPSFFTAIQDLGLKLQPSKATLDVVVIDNVQRLKELR